MAFVFSSAILLRCSTIGKLENSTNIPVQAMVEKDSMEYRVELGKNLFFDPILSRDSTISCATCHKQELAFTDGLERSKGIRGQIVSRNSPTLTNVGNRKHLLWDGVNPSLESQVGVPVQEHTEFDFNILLIVDRLNRESKYVELSKKGYGTEITEWVFLNAIASFERTLISNNSPYDKFLAGNESALSPSQKRGKELFFEKLHCAQCHNGPDFTNEAFTNNGLYEVYADTGRMRLTEKEVDRGIFRVPTLRNVAVTGPYMHNGSIQTLTEVIAHYESGGKNHPGKSAILKPFTLSDDEKIDLIHFLESLTDSTFLQNPDFSLD